MKGVKCFSHLVQVVWKQVRIDIQSDRCRLIPKETLNGFHIGPNADCEACTSVAKPTGEDCGKFPRPTLVFPHLRCCPNTWLKHLCTIVPHIEALPFR